MIRLQHWYLPCKECTTRLAQSCVDKTMHAYDIHAKYMVHGVWMQLYNNSIIIASCSKLMKLIKTVPLGFYNIIM